jgi:hypothetical protein
MAVAFVVLPALSNNRFVSAPAIRRCFSGAAMGHAWVHIVTVESELTWSRGELSVNPAMDIRPSIGTNAAALTRRRRK